MISLKSTSHVTPTPNFHFLTFIKFGLVGFTTAAIYFLVMWALDEILAIQYIVAVSFAYFVSTVFQFLANRHFTFDAAHGQHGRQIFRYVLMWFINYLITILVVRLFVETLHLSPYIGVCVSVLFTMCVGYILGRFWVFKVNEETV
jgi:putative flippase GtrA